MASKTFGTKGPKRAHLVVGKRGVAGEVTDLRSDVEEAFYDVETRASFPTIALLRTPYSLVAGAQSIFVSGSGFGTDTTAISATLGGQALTVPATTDTTLELAASAAVATALSVPGTGGAVALDITVDGILSSISVTLQA